MPILKAQDFPSTSGRPFISFSYKKDWFCGRAFLQYLIWWIRGFGFDGPINIQSDGGVEFAGLLQRII